MSCGTENGRFIHIIPNRVKIIRTLEVFIVKLLSPEVLSIFIQEIDVA